MARRYTLRPFLDLSDVGLLSFVTRSDGRRKGNPRLFKKAQKRLRRAQRRVARREKFSKRWKKAVRLVAKIHRKVFNQRNDFQHQLSRKIVNSYGIIFVEDLNVKGLSSWPQDGRHSFKNFRTRPKAPGEGSRRSILVERASVARVEKQIPNGLRIVSMCASIADWSPRETTPRPWKS